MKIIITTLICTLCLASACVNNSQHHETAQASQPVGIVLKEKDNLPAFDIAVQLTPDVNEQIIATNFAPLFFKARASCISKIAAAQKEPIGFSGILIENGKVFFEGKKNDNLDAFSGCIKDSINGEYIAPLKDDLYVMNIQFQLKQ